MSGTPNNIAVYHLINELSDVTDQDNDSIDKEQEEAFISQEPDKNPENTEQQNMEDVSKRLSDDRQRKRTTITHSQKAVLEEFYANGMTSGGMQFSALHHAAAQRTGLSIHNIQVILVLVVNSCLLVLYKQHWIRNRRRPGFKDRSPISNHKPLDGNFCTVTASAIPSLTANDNMANSSPIYLIDSHHDRMKSYCQSSEASLTPQRPGNVVS